MTCQAAQSKISAYIDGELSGYEMLDMRSHIHRCHECGREYEQLREVKRFLGALSEQDPGEDFRDRLRECALSPRARARYRSAPLALVSSLAFLTALVGSLLLFRAQPIVHHSQVAAKQSGESNFDLSRDQAYQAGSDAFDDASFIITASAPNRRR